MSSSLSMTSARPRGPRPRCCSRVASGVRLRGVGTVDETQHATVDRQHLGQRRERAVELLDEHVLVGPAGDADGVEVGRALALRRKAADRRFQQRALRVGRLALLGFFFGFAFCLVLRLAKRGVRSTLHASPASACTPDSEVTVSSARTIHATPPRPNIRTIPTSSGGAHVRHPITSCGNTTDLFDPRHWNSKQLVTMRSLTIGRAQYTRSNSRDAARLQRLRQYKRRRDATGVPKPR